MKGLPIKDPWVSLILSGKKTWEIRGKSTDIRGNIALIQSGTKSIVGIAKLVRVIGPLGLVDFKESQDKHFTPDEELEDGLPCE